MLVTLLLTLRQAQGDSLSLDRQIIQIFAFIGQTLKVQRVWFYLRSFLEMTLRQA
jgi:hypothetical protein